jgi:hypothetical protein
VNHEQSGCTSGVDAVTVPVPDLDQGLQFYRDQLGHELVWRNDAEGRVGLRLPESQAELVLSTNLEYAVNWLVASVLEAVEMIIEAGGKLILEPGPARSISLSRRGWPVSSGSSKSGARSPRRTGSPSSFGLAD